VGTGYLGLAPQATCLGSYGAQIQEAPQGEGDPPREITFALIGEGEPLE
jgi:hypothetical protein